MAIPTHRLDLSAVSPDVYRAMGRLDASARKLGLETSLVELIKTRVSQINGCAFCIDMHTKDAIAAGEDPARLFLLDAWRESPQFTARERAALGLAEAITDVSGTSVPDDAYEAAAAEFAETELAAVIWVAVVINGWNRVAITSRMEPGHYRPRGAGE